MPKVPHASKHHGNATLIGGGDHFFIANRSARLNHARGACIGHRIQPITEWEKSVGCNCRAFEIEPSVTSLNAGDAC